MQRPATKELLLNVLQSDVLNVTDRLHVGLTCKQAWDLAMPLIWSEWLPWGAIEDLLPADVYLQTKDAGAYGPSRSLSSEDFARFEYYKPHIRRLCAGDEYSLRWKDDFLLAVTKLDNYPGTGPLLENVTHLALDFRLAHVSEQQDLAREIFATVLRKHLTLARISHVHLTLPGSKLSVKMSSHPSSRDSTAGLRKVLDVLAACPGMRYLVFACDDRIESVLADRISQLLLQLPALKRVDMMQNMDAELFLPALASLEQLEALYVQTPLIIPDEEEDTRSYPSLAFPSLRGVMVDHSLNFPGPLINRISSSSMKSFAIMLKSESWIPSLAKNMHSAGWHVSLENLYLAFPRGFWFPIREFAQLTNLRYLSITAAIAALSETPLDLITQDFNMLEGLFIDAGPEEIVLTHDKRKELPVNQFCAYLSRCPQLRYVYVPISIDFPRGLLLDPDLVVPELEYLFAEGINCSDISGAKAFISSVLPKLDRVLATGIDNKAQEVLDELRITFNFPDAWTLVNLRRRFVEQEPPLRHQLNQSLSRRPKKRYARPRMFRPVLREVRDAPTDDTLFEGEETTADEPIVEIQVAPSPLIPPSPSSLQSILSASDIPSANPSTVASTEDDSSTPPSIQPGSIYDLD